MYSYSGLSLADPSNKYGCWYKFYCRYVLGLPSRPGLPLIFGKACHAIIETAINAGSREIIPSLAAAIAATNELDKEEVLQCVDVFFVHSAIKEKGQTEEYFEFPLEDHPFSPSLRGCIDFYQVNKESCILTDWKTNRSTYTPTETQQLGIYAAYLRKKYNLPVIGRLVFLRFGTSFSHEYTDADIEETLEWAREMAHQCEIRKREKGDPEEIFPKCPGDACEYCDYKYYCLATPQEIPETIGSFEEAQEVVEKVALTEEALKLHKDRLKTFIYKNGPVKTATLMATINTSEYLKFSIDARKAVVAKMQEQGLDIGSILKIGSDAQNDLLKKHHWTEQDFLSLGATKGKTTRLQIQGT